MVHRQGIDEGAETQPPRSLSDRRQEHARRRRHAERREVVLSDVVGVKTGAIKSFYHLEPLLVEIAQRQVAAVKMVEDAESQLHACYPYRNASSDARLLAHSMRAE